MIHTLASVLAAAEEGPSGDLLNKILTWGPGGIVVILFLTGLIVPRATVEMWREQLAKEQEAHERTREALSKAVEQADVAREQATIMLTLLRELGHGTNPSGVNHGLP